MALSGFYVPEKNNLDIGFSSFDVSDQFFHTNKLKADHGLRFIGASTGKRGGYFAFGYFTDLISRPDKKFQPGLNLALLAGGGAAAPDQDGWMVHGNVFAQYLFKSGLAFRAGLNYGYVSGGQILGFSPIAGLNWRLRTGPSRDSLGKINFSWSAAYGESGAGKFNEKNLAFVGAGARWEYGSVLAGEAMIHALVNVSGGYMQSLFSGGPDFKLGRFHLIPAPVIGLGGGGGVPTLGGALYGAQLGLAYTGSDFYFGVKYQAIEALSKRFSYRTVFVSFGKMLNADHEARFGWDLVTKAYFGVNGFGNIGARFTAFRYRELRLMGSTFWACTHNKGAYAEGLFEATLGGSQRIPVYLVASAGAGGGSGINQRKAALIYSAGIGYALPFKNFPLSIEAAFWKGGNIPPLSLTGAYRVGKKAE